MTPSTDNVTDKHNGAGFATLMWSVCFLLSALITAVCVSSRNFGRATFFGFCTLYFLMIVRLAFDDWVGRDD